VLRLTHLDLTKYLDAFYRQRRLFGIKEAIARTVTGTGNPTV